MRANRYTACFPPNAKPHDMKLLELAAATFSARLPDGRFIFRPWGALGPCYLLTPRQRSNRAWIQMLYYGAALMTLWFHPLYPVTREVIAGGVVFLVTGHLLHWLYTFGLAKTKPPPRMSREQRRQAMVEHTRATGRPLAWIQLIICSLFVLAGLMVSLLLGEWLAGLASVVFFGAGAALAAWQLRLTRATSAKTN